MQASASDEEERTQRYVSKYDEICKARGDDISLRLTCFHTYCGIGTAVINSFSAFCFSFDFLYLFFFRFVFMCLSSIYCYFILLQPILSSLYLSSLFSSLHQDLRARMVAQEVGRLRSQGIDVEQEAQRSVLYPAGAKGATASQDQKQTTSETAESKCSDRKVGLSWR